MEQSGRPVNTAEADEKASSRGGRRFRPRLLVIYLCLLALCVPAGTFWHEVAGHGLVGMLCGGQITCVEVLGLDRVARTLRLVWGRRSFLSDRRVDNVAGRLSQHVAGCRCGDRAPLPAALAWAAAGNPGLCKSLVD